VYYDVAFSHARIEAAHAAILAAGGESPYAEWIARMERREQRPVTARVHAAEYFPHRDAALRAHAPRWTGGILLPLPPATSSGGVAVEEFEWRAPVCPPPPSRMTSSPAWSRTAGGERDWLEIGADGGASRHP
jgi:mycothiol S-conjugate amidase